MSHPANTEWRDMMRDTMEHLDMELFVEWCDPDWRDHYKYNVDAAFEHIVYSMTPKEFKQKLKESQ